MRQSLTTLGEFLAALLIAVGVGLHDVGGGLVVGGVLFLGLCMLAGLTTTPKASDELTLDDLANMLRARIADAQAQQ